MITIRKSSESTSFEIVGTYQDMYELRQSLFRYIELVYFPREHGSASRTYLDDETSDQHYILMLSLAYDLRKAMSGNRNYEWSSEGNQDFSRNLRENQLSILARQALQTAEEQDIDPFSALLEAAGNSRDIWQENYLIFSVNISPLWLMSLLMELRWTLNRRPQSLQDEMMNLQIEEDGARLDLFVRSSWNFLSQWLRQDWTAALVRIMASMDEAIMSDYVFTLGLDYFLQSRDLSESQQRHILPVLMWNLISEANWPRDSHSLRIKKELTEKIGDLTRTLSADLQKVPVRDTFYKELNQALESGLIEDMDDLELFLQFKYGELPGTDPASLQFGMD